MNTNPEGLPTKKEIPMPEALNMTWQKNGQLMFEMEWMRKEQQVFLNSLNTFLMRQRDRVSKGEALTASALDELERIIKTG